MTTLTCLPSPGRVFGLGRSVRKLIAGMLVASGLAGVEAAPVAEKVDQASANFTKRLEAATHELSATREKIARESTPLMEATRVAEERIAALNSEIAELQSSHSKAETQRQHLQRDSSVVQKNISYLNTLGRDSLRSFNDGLLPGESLQFADKIATLSSQFEATGPSADTTTAIDVAELVAQRLRERLGGSAVPGESLVGSTNRVAKGTFLFFGPEVFFESNDGVVAGTVRVREGSPFPITYPLPGWDAKQARALVTGGMGMIPADASGGKALQLRETTGTVLQHIDRGGPMAYIIIAVGLFALGLAIQKAIELRKLEVDSPAVIETVLKRMVEQSPDEARPLIARMHGASRELFVLGLRHLGKPREVLEEHLFAFTLRHRLQYERRLPLLAVIATASPLMGLLGTVMGMIKTFALITVFGTGNAAKLSSGISEVLVTTELGLTVAIPSLVAHGFLTHRTQKKLSLLERYAVEFVAAAGQVKQPAPLAK